jgi:hypothetical protein
VSENKLMAILLNGVAQIEFDRSKELSDFQKDYLNNMDAKMDQGIVLADATLNNPDVMERVKFVAGNLLHAIKGDDEASAAAFSSYIGTRMPDLKQVRMTDINDEISIELVFDQEYRRQLSIPVATLDS